MILSADSYHDPSIEFLHEGNLLGISLLVCSQALAKSLCRRDCIERLTGTKAIDVLDTRYGLFAKVVIKHGCVGRLLRDGIVAILGFGSHVYWCVRKCAGAEQGERKASVSLGVSRDRPCLITYKIVSPYRPGEQQLYT